MTYIVKYKGWTFFYLGLMHWRVLSPRKNFNFCIKFSGGISELVQRVNLWREIIDNDDY